ncbi:hypothetical protein F383_01597 [Gossypium arboreum]|uniref:Uncharacterized protein n=1 Tax=Gossypium arboreum TaxID=29729 RepID=A0A0B0N4Y7_GOSAR|nr:hypothetical protein F383_33122 [Gossypium arboreum]KHG25567.1 hypothetical protein F383_01597 [Gossypium arboreum]
MCFHRRQDPRLPLLISFPRQRDFDAEPVGIIRYRCVACVRGCTGVRGLLTWRHEQR